MLKQQYLAEDNNNNGKIIHNNANDNFIEGETIIGQTSGASGIAGTYRPNPVQNQSKIY